MSEAASACDSRVSAARSAAVGDPGVHLDGDHAPVELPGDLEAGVGEDPDHGAVLGQHLRGEPAYAGGPGGGRQVLEQEGADAVAAERVGDQEGDLGLVAEPLGGGQPDQRTGLPQAEGRGPARCRAGRAGGRRRHGPAARLGLKKRRRRLSSPTSSCRARSASRSVRRRGRTTPTEPSASRTSAGAVGGTPGRSGWAREMLPVTMVPPPPMVGGGGNAPAGSVVPGPLGPRPLPARGRTACAGTRDRCRPDGRGRPARRTDEESGPMLVRDVMTTQVVTVRPGVRVKEAIQLLDEHQITAMPVVDSEGRLVGVVERGRRAPRRPDARPAYARDPGRDRGPDQGPQGRAT